MLNKFCRPVISTTIAGTTEAIEHSTSNYHFFEVWLDYLTDYHSSFIHKIADAYPERVIFVFRRKMLEPMKMSADSRLDAVLEAARSHAYIDLDISSQKPELEYVRDHGIEKVIASYHNYKTTPDQQTLDALSAQMQSYNPAIVKIAAMCNSEEDAVRLLELQLRLKARSQKHIILGMGVKGMVTHVFGPLWGNEVVFAPESEAEASAPGQLTRSQLLDMFALIKA